MVIIQAFVPFLGGLLVHDDWSIEEVLYLPTTTDEDILNIQNAMQRLGNPWSPVKEIFEAGLCTCFGPLAKDGITYLLVEELPISNEGVIT